MSFIPRAGRWSILATVATAATVAVAAGSATPALAEPQGSLIAQVHGQEGSIQGWPGHGSPPAAVVQVSGPDHAATVGLQGAAHARTRGIALTPAQASKLRRAAASNPDLSVAQAERIASISAEVSPSSSGTGSVAADCSEMTLYGDSAGHWAWTNHFFRRSVGPADWGSISVSTDGFFSSTSSASFDGYDQYIIGKISDVGLFPGGTQVQAWSLNTPLSTNSPLFCTGELYVPWS